MREKLSNNLKLKIIAVLFAVALWMISININDPYQSKDYSVTVQLQNLNIMTGAGKYVEVMEESDEITVRVRGSRSVMENFNVSNLVATADLKELDENNRIPIRLSTVRTVGDKIESIRASEEFLKVSVEDILRIQKNIEVETKNETAEGYILGNIHTEQNALKITGPQSLVKQVGKAVVSLDLAGAKQDVSMLLPIELYDQEGKRIIDPRLTISIEQVQCVASILTTKEVPVILSTKGMEAKGYGFTGEMLQEPKTILIAGKSSALRNMKEIKIADAVDLTGAKENIAVTVDVKEYLPDNIILADNSFDGKIRATALIEKEITVEHSYPERDIIIENVPDNYDVKIDLEDDLPIELTGFPSVINQLDHTELKVTVDLALYMENEGITLLKEGSYRIPAVIGLPDKVWAEKEVTVPVRITKEAQ